MSAPQVFYWPSAQDNIETIAKYQAIGADLTFKIQSNLLNMPNVPVNNSGVYEYTRMIRKVSFASTADLSLSTITIKGLSAPINANGNPSEQLSVFSETLAGPNANTVSTLRIYKRIDSIKISAATGLNLIAAGFGRQGITDYIFLNLNSPSPQWWGMQGQPIDATAAFDYQFYASLTKPFIINDQFGNLSPFPEPIPDFGLGVHHNDNTSISNVASPVGVAAIVWTNVNDQEPVPNASLYSTFIQQGIAG